MTSSYVAVVQRPPAVGPPSRSWASGARRPISAADTGGRSEFPWRNARARSRLHARGRRATRLFMPLRQATAMPAATAWRLLSAYVGAMRDLPNLRKLMVEHPHSRPGDLVGRLPYVLGNPSIMARMSAWVRFRDETLPPMMAARPDDPQLPEVPALCRSGSCVAGDDLTRRPLLEQRLRNAGRTRYAAQWTTIYGPPCL